MTGAHRWVAAARGLDADGYADRFAGLAASGVDVHGEASFCAALAAPGSRILDAGCGTGRVAIRLAELGYDCVGVDADPAMVAVARRSPGVTWEVGDLAQLDGIAALDGPFDLIVAAGNVVPLVAPGTEAAVLDHLAARLAHGGRLVAGFGLDAAHLPLEQAPFGLLEYDGWCAAAGLSLLARHSSWAGARYDGGGYAVSVHRPS